jgi:hypothetical protein
VSRFGLDLGFANLAEMVCARARDQVSILATGNTDHLELRERLWHAERKIWSASMGDFTGPSSNPGDPYREKRSVPRYGLIAQSEIIEPVSGLRIPGRLSEVSRKGCYIDLLTTLPLKTVVEIRITRDRGTFVSRGKIIYTQEMMGMGVAFLDTPGEQLKVLDAWLAELNTTQAD